MSTVARRCMQLCISSCPNAQNDLPGGVKCHIEPILESHSSNGILEFEQRDISPWLD